MSSITSAFLKDYTIVFWLYFVQIRNCA